MTTTQNSAIALTTPATAPAAATVIAPTPPAWSGPANRALDRILPGRRAARGDSLKAQLDRMRQPQEAPEAAASDEPDRADRLEAVFTEVPEPTARPHVPKGVIAMESDLADWNLPELSAEGIDPPGARGCLAETLSAAEVDALTAEGDDPWAVDIATGLYRVEQPVDSRMVLTLARLCAACDDQDGLDRLLSEHAATVVTCTNAEDATVLHEVIRTGPQATVRETPNGRRIPPLSPQVVVIAAESASSLKAEQTRALGALTSPRPLVVIVTDLKYLTGSLLQLPTMALAPVDAEMVLFTLRQAHSATGKISEATLRAMLPDARTLAAMPIDTLLLGLRADGPIRAARRIAELATADHAAPVVDNGPRLETLPGLGAAGAQLAQIGRDLVAYRAGALPWSEIASGLLLTGAPGTGKTTVAAALARTVGVPFLAMTMTDGHKTSNRGSRTIEILATRFAEARAGAETYGAAIVFIDEADSIVSRTHPHDHNSSYFNNVTNAVLAELDGAVAREGIIVIGATNHPDKLDPALVRPGRLGTHIVIDNPSTQDLPKVFRYHLGADLANVDLGRIARAASGMSMAEVMGLVQAARQTARMAGRDLVEDDLFAGHVRTRLPVSEALRTRIAVHEAGHAVAAHVTGTAQPKSLHLSSTGAGGGGHVRMHHCADARSRSDFTAELVMHLAGHAAEEVLLGDASGGSGGGATSDLAQATRLAITEVLAHSTGSDLVWSAPEGDPAAIFARHEGLRDRVARRLDDAHARALRLVSENRAAIESIAGHLLADGTVTGETLNDLLCFCARGVGENNDPATAGWPRA